MKYLIFVLLATSAFADYFCPDPVMTPTSYGYGYTGCSQDSICAQFGSGVSCRDNRDNRDNGLCQKQPKTCTSNKKCYFSGSDYKCKVPEGQDCTVGGTPCEGNLVCRNDGSGYKCLTNSSIPSPYSCYTTVPQTCATGRTCQQVYQILGVCLVSPYGLCKGNDCTSGYTCYKGKCMTNNDIPRAISVGEVYQKYVNMRECIFDFTSWSGNPDYVGTCSQWNLDRNQCCKTFALPACISHLDGISQRPGVDIKNEVYNELINYNGDFDYGCKTLSKLSQKAGLDLSLLELWPIYEGNPSWDV